VLGTTLILSDVIAYFWNVCGLRVLEARPYELDQNGDARQNHLGGLELALVDADVILKKKSQPEAFRCFQPSIQAAAVENLIALTP